MPWTFAQFTTFAGCWCISPSLPTPDYVRPRGPGWTLRHTPGRCAPRWMNAPPLESIDWQEVGGIFPPSRVGLEPGQTRDICTRGRGCASLFACTPSASRFFRPYTGRGSVPPNVTPCASLAALLGPSQRPHGPPGTRSPRLIDLPRRRPGKWQPGCCATTRNTPTLTGLQLATDSRRQRPDEPPRRCPRSTPNPLPLTAPSLSTDTRPAPLWVRVLVLSRGIFAATTRACGKFRDVDKTSYQRKHRLRRAFTPLGHSPGRPGVSQRRTNPQTGRPHVPLVNTY